MRASICDTKMGDDRIWVFRGVEAGDLYGNGCSEDLWVSHRGRRSRQTLTTGVRSDLNRQPCHRSSRSCRANYPV